MPFFQPPIRLDDFQRANTAFPVASTSAALLPDSPSPNKKRRVGSVPPSLTEGQRIQAASHSRAASQSPAAAPRSQAASRKSVSDAARRSEINARYAELSRDEARLQATLRLQDAWEDIQRRHSKLASSGVASDPCEHGDRPGPGDGGHKKKKRYRHRPGRTRALPVEEDDIIDLATLDFVQDRGVLRSSKAGGFAIGRFGNGRDGDVLVGLDTGGAETASSTGRADANASDRTGNEEDPTDDDDEEEDDEEDEWADYTDSDASSYSSDDELGEDDDLLPPPSLLFREQRRKEAERLKEMYEFQEHEAKARGEMARAQQQDEVVVLRGGGNVQLPAPIGPPQSAPRRRPVAPSFSTDDEDDDLALSPVRPRLAVAGVCTPARASPLAKAASQPPSSTSTLRRSVSDIRLNSPSSARTLPRRAGTVKPSVARRSMSAAVTAPASARQSQSVGGMRSPPASFSSGPLPAARRPSLSRLPLSSSPLREVITVASPTPPPQRPRAPSLSHKTRPRAPSPELFAPAEATKAGRTAAKQPSPELFASVPTPLQQATPTPTPPPAPPARKPPTVPARAVSVKPVARKARHSFELIIDVKPPARLTPSPSSDLKRPASSKALAPSASMPNLPAVSAATTALAPSKTVNDRKEDVQAPRRVGGLSTPPLSKRSTASRRSPSQSPAKAQAPFSSTAISPGARVTATPSVILPVPPSGTSGGKGQKFMAAEDGSDEEEDELMLSSPTKPTPPRYSSVRPSTTPATGASCSRTESRLRAKSRSVSAFPPERAAAAAFGARRPTGRIVAVSDESSEDEFGQCRVTVASSAVELTPQRAAWLLELVVSVSTTCHGLAIISYLLSPAHFLILAYRVVLQVQFTLPRRVHANRSLRFFVALWGLQAAVAIALHAATGSQGTKGPKGYVQRGLILDFVGQAFTPSTLHLVALDVLLAALQLVTIVLAFGATVPSDLDATTSGESSRDYSSLLGIGEYEDASYDYSQIEGRDQYRSTDARDRSGFGGLRNGYSAAVGDEYDGRSDLFTAEEDELGTSYKYSASAADPALRLRVPVPLIASVRLGTIWREICKSSSQDQAEQEEGGLRGLEEGRGPS
ncbi:hypothetical protein JCM3774_006731 [Rhodotorula dairenensis]